MKQTIMKKFLAMVAVAMMTAMSANAQSAGDLIFKGRLGGNVSTVTNNDDAKWKIGYSVSVGFDYMITNKLSAVVELNHNLIGSKSELADKNANLDYTHIPVLAKYYVTPWLALQAGPQIGFLFNAKIDGKSFKSTCKKTEFSIPLGASVEIPITESAWMDRAIIDLRYHLGLTNTNKSGSENCYNRAFILTVGYMFDL